jgi:DNA modification methylase
MCDVIDELLRVTKRHVFFNIQANYYNRQDVYKLIGKYSEKIVEIVIWEKDNPMPASGLNITNAVEYFIVLGDEPLRSNRTYTKNTIHSSVNSKMGKIHKAVMNQDIADYFISTFTKEGESVLDCFLGLGTTGIACVKFNRDFQGSEKDVEYFSIAEKRIQEAVLSQGFFTPSNTACSGQEPLAERLAGFE